MTSRHSQVPRNKGKKKKGPPAAVRKLIVEKAKEQTNVLSLCKEDSLTHMVEDSPCTIEHVSSVDADDSIKTWVLDITRENIKEMYIESGWGWSDEEKGDELHDEKAQYLLVKNAQNELIAFTHFRFDMDYGSQVLYCYELQVNSKYQSSGIGAWVMNLLHQIAKQSRMEKVVITVTRNNPRGLKFYFRFGYAVDETSPSTLADPKSGHYLILSLDLSKPTQGKNKENIALVNKMSKIKI